MKKKFANFSERMKQRRADQEEYFNRFGHHYSTYGYYSLDTQKDHELLQECLEIDKPITEVLDSETLEIIRKAATGKFTSE